MRFSLKIFFFISMLLLGAACATVAAMAEDLFPIPRQFQGLPLYVGVGIVFGMVAYFLVVILYPKEGSPEKPKDTGVDTSTRKDPGTGLLNRSAFDRDMAYLKATLYSIIIMDVDNFKALKEEVGTQVADSLLQKIGKVARAHIRKSDRVYKYEGDLFAVTLINCDKDQAIKITEKIRVQVSQLDNSPFPGITVSAAVVSYPQDGDQLKELLQVSEELLQSAKKSGKNSTFALARGKIS